ncbi:hypothetical protein BpHYR1_025222 [Brachionus plicatilis]|uniref:Uncharacterized protein n=1 Tax=Brachionus plicatilis TaxID=10195 RepID=A0A3M7PRR2_BRAPC|nr:hypothetical protein BpHYR1_025222 [Brachionus plicatilis]
MGSTGDVSCKYSLYKFLGIEQGLQVLNLSIISIALCCICKPAFIICNSRLYRLETSPSVRQSVIFRDFFTDALMERSIKNFSFSRFLHYISLKNLQKLVKNPKIECHAQPTDFCPKQKGIVPKAQKTSNITMIQ